MAIVDASVAIKWFVEEPDSPAAHRLLETHRIGTTSLVAPDLLIYEVANDALYVALARHLELPFYTADRKLLAKLHGLPFLRSL